MDLYFGSLEISEISHPKVYRYLFAFTFYPVLLSLKMTQMGVLLLLAMAGFAYFQNQKRPLLAALFLSATILKPHLFILIWIVVLLKRQWTCVAVTAGVIALLSGLVLISDHQIFREYVQLMTGDYPRIALAGILGGVRSALEPHDTYWLLELERTPAGLDIGIVPERPLWLHTRPNAARDPNRGAGRIGLNGNRGSLLAARAFLYRHEYCDAPDCYCVNALVSASSANIFSVMVPRA